MTVLRARALDAQGQPIAGRTAVLEPWTGNRYRSPYSGPSAVRGLTAVSGSDGWLSWTLPALQRRPGPKGALWLVTGLEAQPVVLATQPGDTTTTGTRVGTVSPTGELVPTPLVPVDTAAQATAAAQAAVSTLTAGAPASLDTLAEVGAELQGRLSDAALRAALGASPITTVRLRAAAIGDSTTAGDLRSVDQVPVLVGNTWAPMDVQVQQAGPRSWFTHACLLSGGRLVHHYNAGIGSDTTVGMAARFATDIVAKKPDVVFLGDAHNDFTDGSGITEATTRANIAAMVTAARAAGIVPILHTIYPDNNDAVYGAEIRRHNAWLRKYATDQRILLVDTYAAVVDPASATGAWQSAYQLDGTHASYAGAVVAGQRVLAQLGDLLRGGPAWLPSDNVKSANLLSNPLMQTTSGTAGLAANWVRVGTVTPTLTTDAAVLGKVQGIDVTASSSSRIYQDLNVDGTTIKVGDRLKWAGMFKVTAAVGAMNWSLDLSFPGIGSYIVRPMDRVTGLDYPWAYFECEAVVPAGATIVRVGGYAYSGTGSIYLAQQGLYNLSTL